MALSRRQHPGGGIGSRHGVTVRWPGDIRLLTGGNNKRRPPKAKGVLPSEDAMREGRERGASIAVGCKPRFAGFAVCTPARAGRSIHTPEAENRPPLFRPVLARVSANFMAENRQNGHSGNWPRKRACSVRRPLGGLQSGDAIGPLPVRPLLGDDLVAEALPDHAGDRTANGVGLPAGSGHHLGDGRAAGVTHCIND